MQEIRVSSARARRRAIAGCMAGRRAIGKLWRDRRGAVAVEYAFVVALIVLAIMAAIAELAQTNFEIWTNVADKVVKA